MKAEHIVFSIFVGFLVLSVGAGIVRGQSIIQLNVAETTKERLFFLESEIAELGDHEWAGNYVQGLGGDTWISFYAAPKHGAVFQFHGNSGVVSQGCASVEVNNAKMILKWEKATIPIESLATELLVVQFRSKVFLVPPREIHAFCLEQDSDYVKYFCLNRSRDLQTREYSVLILPKDYRKFKDLPANVARVIQTEEAAIFRYGDAFWGVQSISLNKGANDSVVPGSRFNASGNPLRSIRITNVMEDKSIAEFEYSVGPKKGFQQINLGEVFRSGSHVMDFAVFANGDRPLPMEAVKVPSEKREGNLFPIR